jgi:hypothetical protein
MHGDIEKTGPILSIAYSLALVKPAWSVAEHRRST